MYYKLPYISGIDPSINLNPQIQNVALFQGMILLYSNHVDSFTLPQTFMLHIKWTRHRATGDTKINKTGLAPALMSRQEKTQISYKLVKYCSKIKQGPKMDNYRLECEHFRNPAEVLGMGADGHYLEQFRTFLVKESALAYTLSLTCS